MSQVVIDDVTPRTQLVATAGQTVFNTNWTADVGTDIDVYARAESEIPDDLTQLVNPIDYTVTFIGASENVRVTFLSPRALNDVITIVRNTPAERQNLYINTNFVPSMLNQDFGILTLVDQQNQMYGTVVNPGYNVSATIDEKDKVLPVLGAQQTWRMNADATAIEPYIIDSEPAPSGSFFITYAADPNLDNEQNLGLLGNGILKQTVTAGSAELDIAIQSTDYWAPGDLLTRPQPPINFDDVTNKEYVDAIASGFSFVSAANAASTGNFSSTYNNGAAGVGATLTALANGAFTLDGEAGVLTNRYLMKDQTAPAQNGVYTLIQLGDGLNPAILMRATDFDTTAEIIPGNLIPVLAGTVNINTIWVQTATVTTIGTSAITFVKFSISPNEIVTLSGNQTITGQKIFNANTTLNNLFFTGNSIQHLADLNNQVLFGTDTQSYETGGASRMDISDTGFRLGAANARVTTILTDATMAAASNTNLYTGLAIKTYIGSSPGRIVQQQITPFTAAGSTTTIIPADNTIPQITEGAQFTTVTITPTSATNILMLELFVPLFSMSPGTSFIGAFFRDATANAIASMFGGINAGTFYFPYTVVAGSTAATTFRFRFGPGAAGTAYCNQGAGAPLFSTSSLGFFRVTEIAL